MSDPVLELIQKNNLAFSVSGRDYLIKCLNPDHSDSNPSFRVDKVTGVAHCFACGFKTNLFKYYGVFTNPVPMKILALKEKLDILKKFGQELELPLGYTPWTKTFRGISPATLRHFGAFYTTQVEKLQDRIIFPIKDITNKTQVFVGRHTMSNGNPRYLNYPSGVKIPLYPAHLPSGYSSMVLVEGIFDMLNLYDNGCENVVCAFGTNTLQNDTKQKLLPFRAQGITHIYILFDGDDAGRKAAQLYKPILEEEGFIVEIVVLPDGTDPGDLDVENVRSIAEYVNK
ncbi:MAG: toprim domain-containing protein [Candidatus Nanopelagicus sp.]